MLHSIVHNMLINIIAIGSNPIIKINVYLLYNTCTVELKQRNLIK